MKRIPLELELDDEADAAYVSLSGEIADGAVVANLLLIDDRLRGEIVIDLDADDNVLGIEFIGFASMLGTSADS